MKVVVMLILVTAWPCFAKGPMLQGRFGDEGRWIEFTTIDFHGTTTRVAGCNLVPECEKARVDTAVCVQGNDRQCPYLVEIVPVRIQFFPQSSEPWSVTYAWETDRERPLFTVVSTVTGDHSVTLNLASQWHVLPRAVRP